MPERSDRPWIDADDFASDPRFVSAPPLLQDLARTFHDTGLVVLPSAVQPDLRAAVRADLDSTFGEPADRSLRPNRIAEAWEWSDAVRRLAGDAGIVGVVEFLHGRPAFPFQTLNFKWGTEQRGHRDSLHFDTLPSGFMCGVWVALEDVGPTQGPLRYHPGSHRITPPDAGPGGRRDFDYEGYEDEIERFVGSHGLPAVDLTAEAGDAVVWSAALIHGGASITDDTTTRWSQVTHYFFEGCTYVTPMYSRLSAREYAVREPMIDLRTGRRVAQVTDPPGARIVRVGAGRSRIVHDGDPQPSASEQVASAVRGAAMELRHGSHRLRRRLRSASLRRAGRRRV